MVKKNKNMEEQEQEQQEEQVIEEEQITEQQEHTRTRYTFKDYAEQITSIKNATETIRLAVDEMPDCTAKAAFELSVKNLDTKLNRFGKESAKIILSDEEKSILAAHREGKLKFQIE